LKDACILLSGILPSPQSWLSPTVSKRGPFQESEVSMEELAERIDQLQGSASFGKDAEGNEPVPAEESTSPKV